MYRHIYIYRHTHIHTHTHTSYHSHKKRKDRLEGSLDRVLFAAELEFPKILVPRLPQHTSDVNIECAGKAVWSKQLRYLYVTNSWSTLVHFNFIILILICF